MSSRLRRDYGVGVDGWGQRGRAGWQNAEQKDPGVVRVLGRRQLLLCHPLGPVAMCTKNLPQIILRKRKKKLDFTV